MATEEKEVKETKETKEVEKELTEKEKYKAGLFNHLTFKKCPFCNGEAVMIKTKEGKYVIECTKCSARAAESDTKERAMERWNRRARQKSEKKADKSKDLSLLWYQ